MSPHQLGYWLDSSLWVWVSSNATKEMHDRDNMEVDNATQQLNIVSAISFDAWLWQGERTYSFIVTTKARTMYDLSSVGGSAVWDISWVDTRHIHEETAPELLWAVEYFELAFISYRSWSKTTGQSAFQIQTDTIAWFKSGHHWHFRLACYSSKGTETTFGTWKWRHNLHKTV